MAEALKDKTVCFSGTLSTQTRAEATKVAKKLGAKVTSSVSGKTDILIFGPTGAGSKVKQAKAKGIEVWTEKQFNVAAGGEIDQDEKDTKRNVKSKKKAVDDASSPLAKKKVKTEPTKKKVASTPTKSPNTTPSTPQKKTKKKPKIEPATPAKPGSSVRKVMSSVVDADQYRVYGDYDVKLMLSDSLNANSNKFYKLQLLQHITDDTFYVATNWGRLGESGQSQLKGPHPDEETGRKEFGKVFRSKTKNTWGEDPFVRYEGKYQLVETTNDDTDEATADAALGRLTEAQIYKGQEVLKQLRSALEDKDSTKTKRGRKTTNPNMKTLLGQLSNEFYSLIPTTSGRQRPPPLDNLDIVTEKEGLLQFWLRMGFEELGDGTVEGSPIEGVFDLPLPSTLKVAASGITDAGSISSSKERGSQLAQKGVIKNQKMGSELYAAILMYTGNSIYRQLNRCLRSEWKTVPKYWNYLRLYFEAMDALEGKSNTTTTLYRGIAADLYDEYEPGKIITWWSISSCTASKDVAQDFMNQLGGTAATFLTLRTKKACDVSSLSFYPHEQESLLRPGTKLKVLNRNRNGTVVEIEVEEIL